MYLSMPVGSSVFASFLTLQLYKKTNYLTFHSLKLLSNLQFRHSTFTLLYVVTFIELKLSLALPLDMNTSYAFVCKSKWRGLGVERPESRGVADGNLGQKLGNTGKKAKE